MPVAFTHTQPQFCGGLEATELFASFANHTKLESSNDSDDDYEYVATLAEQIAHAMLDDDDCQGETSFREQQIFEVCSLSRRTVSSNTHVQENANDIWCRPLDSSRKISHGRKSSHSLSSLMPFHNCGSALPNRSNGLLQDQCSGSGFTLQSSPSEDDANSSARGSTSNVACQHLSQSLCSPLVTDSLVPNTIAVPTAERAEIFVHAPKFRVQKPGSDGVLQREHSHGNLEGPCRGWPSSTWRCRNSQGDRHQISRDDKGGRACGRYRSVQAARGISSSQSVLPDRAVVHPSAAGYDSSWKATAGTGVFLPRANSPRPAYCRKSEGGIITTKSMPSPKNILDNANLNISRDGGDYVRRSHVQAEFIL